jgi:thymidylate kinase
MKDLMMNKRLQLVFEGPDCSGKTTQYQKIWKNIQSANEFDVLLNDRGLMSILVYGKLNNRYDNFYERQKEFISYLNDNIVFYFDIDEVELFNRYSNRGDEFQSWESIRKVAKLYKEFSTMFAGHRNFWIINAKDKPNEIADRIISILNMYEDFLLGPEHQIGTAITALQEFGSEHMGTKELINYKMDFDLKGSDIDTWAMKDLYTGLENINDYKDLEIDSYKFQLAKFRKKLEAELSGYYGKKQLSDSRRFVFTDDECLSYVHMLFRGDILYVNVNFRSSNIMLFNHDFISICKMIQIWFIKCTRVEKIKLNIKFDSLHFYI